MKQIIYRRENISIAFKQNGFVSGCNLYIWYGYIDEQSKQCGLIIDTSIIKADMQDDLKDYDHFCIEVHNGNDIIDYMIEIGKMIFKRAKDHPLMHEIILSDIYGDEVIIRRSEMLVQKKCLYNLTNNKVVFCCNDSQRNIIYGLPFHTITLTYKENLNESQLRQLMCDEDSDIPYYVSYIDEPSSVSLTFFKKDCVPAYITICCIEQIAHKLSNVPVSQKCRRLHGHTYCCRVTIRNSSRIPITIEYVTLVSQKIRMYLKTAFNFGNLSATTIENIARYLEKKLCGDYEVAFIELFETSNIRTRIYMEDNIFGGII